MWGTERPRSSGARLAPAPPRGAARPTWSPPSRQWGSPLSLAATAAAAAAAAAAVGRRPPAAGARAPLPAGAGWCRVAATAGRATRARGGPRARVRPHRGRAWAPSGGGEGGGGGAWGPGRAGSGRWRRPSLFVRVWSATLAVGYGGGSGCGRVASYRHNNHARARRPPLPPSRCIDAPISGLPIPLRPCTHCIRFPYRTI